MRSSLRRGVQVHAVPESERAFDASGRQLPWGYEYGDADNNYRRQPEERGPFGKSTRLRSTLSRTRTLTPARKEDQATLDNQRVVDDIFNTFKKEQDKLVAAGAHAAPVDTSAAAGTSAPQEPTEVMLHGFGSDVQWAAIDFYERISTGLIYEDYDRHPPHAKYDMSLSLSRATAQRSLSQAALTKKNQYIGGEHWIKVTFDSSEAADQACFYSPHVIQGFLVSAERWRGVPPPADTAIWADAVNAAAATASPSNSLSTQTLTAAAGGVDGRASPSPSSQTVSSATAIPTADDTTGPPNLTQRHPSSTSTTTNFLSPKPSSTSPTKRGPRIAGAKLIALRPATDALLPAKHASPWSTLPIVSLFAGAPPHPHSNPGAGAGSAVGGQGSSHALIGTEVPRTAQGGFDWAHATVWWVFWYFLDCLFGSDFCGLRGDD